MTADFTFPEERFLLVGKITKAHGIGGEVKIMPYGADSASLLAFHRAVLVDGRGRLSRELTVARSRLQGNTALVKFTGIETRNDAEELQNAGMLVPKDDLPEDSDHKFRTQRIRGLQVRCDGGEVLGRVDSVFSNGAQDIMVVTQGDREYLIPMVAGVIKEQSEAGIVILPPPGLLEMNQGDRD